MSLMVDLERGKAIPHARTTERNQPKGNPGKPFNGANRATRRKSQKMNNYGNPIGMGKYRTNKEGNPVKGTLGAFGTYPCNLNGKTKWKLPNVKKLWASPYRSRR